MKFNFCFVAALAFSGLARAEKFSIVEASNALAQCASFSGPLVAAQRWIGEVTKEKQKISETLTETQYVFQSYKAEGFVGAVKAPVSLKVLQRMDSSNGAADAPSTVTYSCELGK